MSEQAVSDIEAFLDLGFHFIAQPDPIAASLRPKRRISLLLLIMSQSHGRKLDWRGVHLLNWAVRDSSHMDLLVSLNAGEDIPDLPIVRIEPVLDRAIDLALGLGFITQNKGRVFQLTAHGATLAGEVERSPALRPEKEQLARIPGRLTQAQVGRLLEWRQ